MKTEAAWVPSSVERGICLGLALMHLLDVVLTQTRLRCVNGFSWGIRYSS